ncbi:MAG TPA: hypothetical protein VEG32_14420 [Clostridia bacterium]|nr:hypothetical protein [Clostridia bacterium]
MRVHLRLGALLLFLAAVAAVCGAQSLGDVAREERGRQRTPSKRVYTDEDLRSDDKVNGAAAPAAETPADEKADRKEAERPQAAEEEEIAKEEKKASEKLRKDVFRAVIEQQKKSVADITREIDLNEREWKLRASAYYGDAGARLRNERKWVEDEKKHQEEMVKLRLRLDAAKKALDEAQETARKAGLGNLD